MSMIDPSDIFRTEAAELLETLEQTLLDLEKTPADADLVALAFRAMHTIKGSGAMFGFDNVSSFMHAFETAFDDVRKGRAPATPALVSAALEARDFVEQLISGQETELSAGDAILERLRVATRGEREPVSAPFGWHVRFRLPADALALGTDPLLLLDEFRSLGQCEIFAHVDDLPRLEELTPKDLYLSWEVKLLADVALSAIEDIFMFVRDGMELDIQRLGADRAEDTAAAPSSEMTTEAQTVDVAVKGGRDARSTLRVSAERLDELMDRVGELVIAQARLSQIAQTRADPALATIAEEIERLISGLRDTTMSTRMVPIGSLFGRFRRLVHDLSSELGKPVEFLTEGEETELDKTVVEQLADPLIHLIRNAIDHGLELPALRQENGKAATGAIRLSAAHRGAEVAITIADDGAGLNLARIRARAIEAGLIQPDAAVSENDLHQMIFHPGFSTAREVSTLSGRGVGMDVVKRTIETLRGSIDVGSEPGHGTSVTLRLPLTLAIIDGLLVRVGADRYTIPLAAVEECIELPPAEVEATGRSFLNIRGKLVPFLKLRELFGSATEADVYQKVVVVTSGSTSVGLVVDQIIGNNQTVIKHLSRVHSGLKTFSGATILGDGNVALILDVINLVEYGQAEEIAGRKPKLGRAA